ncbi:MAG: calcium-binding protein [Actinomycetota bacterium]
MTRARKLGSILGTAVLVGGVLGGAAPASSGPAATCAYNDTVGLVTVEIPTGGSATVDRDGDFIDVNGTRCIDGLTEATVDNTEVINIVPGGTGGQRAVLSLSSGPFGPGRTDEVGTSDEIEIFVNLGGGNDSLRVAGSNQRDTMVAGTLDGQSRVNLNADEEATVDYDLSVDDSVEGLVISGNGKGDSISATGSFGTGTVLQRAITIAGGDGNDDLTGGRGADVLTDRSGTGDTDVLVGKGGDDRVSTRDGDRRDRAIGGPGNDTCVVDRRDTAIAC